MKKNLIIVYGGEYSNNDAYKLAVGYILKKPIIGGCPFPQVFTESFVINQFIAHNPYPLHESGKMLWHFTISIPGLKTPILQQWADTISAIFGSKYDILYGIDLDQGHHHIHFVVNVFGHSPTTPILTDTLFHSYLLQIQNLLIAHYTSKRTEIIYKEGHQSYV